MLHVSHQIVSDFVLLLLFSILINPHRPSCPDVFPWQKEVTILWWISFYRRRLVFPFFSSFPAWTILFFIIFWSYHNSFAWPRVWILFRDEKKSGTRLVLMNVRGINPLPPRVRLLFPPPEHSVVVLSPHSFSPLKSFDHAICLCFSSRIVFFDDANETSSFLLLSPTLTWPFLLLLQPPCFCFLCNLLLVAFPLRRPIYTD